MKPRFEEHDNQLFRMLEEPEPLTTDAKLPCLVRLIQDDSPMGSYNRDAAYFDVIGKLFVAQKIKENPFYSNTLHAYEKDSNGQDSCIASIHQLEIIGYPVEEGSRWWALYQMMQGKKVSYKRAIGNVYWALNQDGNVQYYDMDNLAYIGSIRSKLEFGKNQAIKTVWQLYEEPKIEPPKEPDYVICKRCGGTGYEIKEQFEVGDWVEYRLDRDTYYGKICNIRGYVYYLSVTTEENPKDQARAIMLERIIRKLSPSEIVVRIGCLRGTVKRWDSTTFHMFHGNSKFSKIDINALDTRTRELVKSLLKAQEEEK